MRKENLFHLDKAQIEREETKLEVREGQGVCVCVCVCVPCREEEVSVQESHCYLTCLLGSYHWAYRSHQLHFPKLIPCRTAIDKLH